MALSLLIAALAFPVPGNLNPDVTQATINKTICVSGWTATIRPPYSYTHKLKIKLWAAEGKIASLSSFQLDHRIPLELGGAPDASNMVLEAYPEAHNKDWLENKLHRLVCSNDITLWQAQYMIAVNWQAAYTFYKGAN